MSLSLPRITGFSPFAEIGFYDFLYLKECTLKALKKNLFTEPDMPDQMPSRQSLVGIFHHRVMELVFKMSSVSDLERAIEIEILKTQQEVDSWVHLGRLGSVSGWDEINCRISSICARQFPELVPLLES